MAIPPLSPGHGRRRKARKRPLRTVPPAGSVPAVTRVEHKRDICSPAFLEGCVNELLRLHLHELPRSLMGLDRKRRIELLAERPPLTGTPWDVLLAAMVEHVCELHDLEPPAWSQERERFVDIPHFFTTRHDYIETVVYAPAAFVRHGALANARDLDARGGEKHVWIPGSRPDPTALW